MPLLRIFILLFVASVFALPALAATSTGSSSFNGKEVRYAFTGDEVTALSYAGDGSCHVKATVDGSSHTIVISDTELEWNGNSVVLDGFKDVSIVVVGDEARFTVDGRAVTMPSQE